MKEQIVIATWGIGPSYRQCVKDYVNSMTKKNSLYDLHIVIMTDYVEFFDDISVLPEVKYICNLLEVQNDVSVPIEKEMIPVNKFDPAFRKEVSENKKKGFAFSYNMKRFLLPVMAKLGYMKFFLIDPDHELIFNAELAKHLETPPNTISGICPEKIWIDTSTIEPHSMTYAIAFGRNSLHVITDMRLALHLMYQEIGEDRFAEDIYEGVHITEGPLRYFNFTRTEDIMKFFKYWETFVRVVYNNPGLNRLINTIGDLRTDFIPVAAAAIGCQMPTLRFQLGLYTGKVYPGYKIGGDGSSTPTV